MILEVSENESKYGKYFLAFEAPNSKTKKWNMKVVTVKPNRRARLDFTNDIVDIYRWYAGRRALRYLWRYVFYIVGWKRCVTSTTVCCGGIRIR